MRSPSSNTQFWNLTSLSLKSQAKRTWETSSRKCKPPTCARRRLKSSRSKFLILMAMLSSRSWCSKLNWSSRRSNLRGKCKPMSNEPSRSCRGKTAKKSWLLKKLQIRSRRPCKKRLLPRQSCGWTMPSRISLTLRCAWGGWTCFTGWSSRWATCTQCTSKQTLTSKA